MAPRQPIPSQVPSGVHDEVHSQAAGRQRRGSADRLAFISDEGTVASASIDRGGSLTFQEQGVTSVPFTDVDPAADQIARLLNRYHTESLVVYTSPAYSQRGDEEFTADIYPPHPRPRITIGRS